MSRIIYSIEYYYEAEYKLKLWLDKMSLFAHGCYAFHHITHYYIKEYEIKLQFENFFFFVRHVTAEFWITPEEVVNIRNIAVNSKRQTNDITIKDGVDDKCFTLHGINPLLRSEFILSVLKL